jgi:hypothetical protein
MAVIWEYIIIFFLSKTEFDWTQTVYGPVQMLIFCLNWKSKMANTTRQIDPMEKIFLKLFLSESISFQSGCCETISDKTIFHDGLS